MTLAQVSQVAQAISSAAVVASLVFVGIQLNRNTKATRAASHHAITEALNHVNLAWARDEDLARIWFTGIENRQVLASHDRWRFDSVLRAYVHVCETMYTQASLGIGDADMVSAEEEGLKFVFGFMGVREWWRDNPFGFSQSFRDYVEGLTGLK